MAKQLLGKEVTAALNEKIKANVAALKEKGISLYDTEDALLEYPAEMQLKNALKLVEKTVAKSKKKSFNECNQKITQALLNKGYSSELASQVRQSWHLSNYGYQ